MRFVIHGQELLALNAGPQFLFTEAISLSVDCEDQAEVDRLKDKFGLSWQIVPSMMPRVLVDPNAQKVKRVMESMMQMQKLDIAQLQAAYEVV